MGNLLSVSEFAAATNTSKQNIYQQLETRLKDYVIRIKGKTFIDEAALKIFEEIQVHSSGVDQVEQVEQVKNDDNKAENQVAADQVEQATSKQIEQVAAAKDYTQQYIDSLLQQIDELKTANAKKDEQLQEYNKQIIELMNKQQLLTEEAMSITNNLQLLEAAKMNEGKKLPLLQRIFKRKPQDDNS